MKTVLLDDHLLLRVLLGNEPASLRPRGAALATTGLWYHRLCRALTNEFVVGSMSRQLGGLEPAVAQAVIGSVIELPDTIELVSLRNLGWPMGRLINADVRLNLLSLEALAASEHLGAEICLAEQDANEPLVLAAGAVGAPVRIVHD